MTGTYSSRSLYSGHTPYQDPLSDPSTPATAPIPMRRTLLKTSGITTGGSTHIPERLSVTTAAKAATVSTNIKTKAIRAVVAAEILSFDGSTSTSVYTTFTTSSSSFVDSSSPIYSIVHQYKRLGGGPPRKFILGGRDYQFGLVNDVRCYANRYGALVRQVWCSALTFER